VHVIVGSTENALQDRDAHVPLQERLFCAGAGRDGGDDGQLADPVGVHRAQDVRGPFGVNGSWLPGRSDPGRRHDSVRPGQRFSQGGAVEYVCRRADRAALPPASYHRLQKIKASYHPDQAISAHPVRPVPLLS
jgi:hypothetical protein